MDNKMYVWLFNNINKYEFKGDKANQIKSSISRMLVTEDSISSDSIVAKMQSLYSTFCELFYNNIIGYQNGLATNSITASELDCYLIQTSEGMVPIGYYRAVRPAETASMVQRYLDQCKKDINSERNQTVVKWQSNIDDISQKYDLIKNSKNPSVFRMVFGIVLSFAIVALSIVSLLKINLIEVMLNWGDNDILVQALSRVPFIANGSQGAWIGYLIFVVCSLALAMFGVVFTLREIKLIVDRKTTKNILSSILSYVTRLEQGVLESIENSLSVLYDAARRGENVTIIPNANAILTANVEKRIKTANEYVAKSEAQRTGIGYALIILLAIFVILFPLSYSQVVADGIENIQMSSSTSSDSKSFSSESSSTYNNATTPTPTPTQTPVPVEKTKVSSYIAYKSDATWSEANQNAEQMGGYLVCINNSEEFERVCKKADEQNIKVFWVGAYRNSYDDWEDTQWCDGEDITFTRWLQGEPTYYSEDGEDENYLMVFKVNGTWYFNDAINDVSEYYSGKMGYIVETEE